MWDDGGFVGDGSGKKNTIKLGKAPHFKRMFKAPRKRRSRRSSGTLDIQGSIILFWFMAATFLLIIGLCETPQIYLYVYTILILLTIYQKNTGPLWELTIGLMSSGISVCLFLVAVLLVVLILNGNISPILLLIAYFAGVPTLSLILCKCFDRIFYR